MQVNSNSTAYGVEGVKGVTMFGKPAGPYAAQTPSVPNVAGSYRRESQSSLFTGSGSNLVPKTQILEDLGWGDYAYAEGKSFYTHMQYSRFIKQGYTQIDIGHEQMVAFVSPDRTELVIVAFSWTGNSNIGPTQIAWTNTLNTTVDLSAFPGATTAEVYRTTGGTSQTSWGDSCARLQNQNVSNGTLNVNITAASQVYTYVIKNSAGAPLYARTSSNGMVSSEIVYANPKYSTINKFAYTGLNTTWTKQMWHQSFPGDGTGKTAFLPSAAHALQFMQWSSTYNPRTYTQWASNLLAANPSRNAYGFSVRRATADGASVSFTFNGKSVAIWGLLKDAANAASFSVAVNGETVAANGSNLGTTGANACLYDTGPLNGDGPHTLTITKIGAAGQLDIGNAKIGYDISALYAAIQAYKASGTADLTHKTYLNAVNVYTAPVSSQADIDMAAALLTTLTYGTNVSIQKTGQSNVTAAYGIANDTGGALTVNLLLAIYNDKGQMLSVIHKDVTVQEDLSIEKMDMVIPAGSNGTVKAFIWDTSFIPLCPNAAFSSIVLN
jgi:3D (Asp-Asp-Asp) domain-containing protein